MRFAGSRYLPRSADGLSEDHPALYDLDLGLGGRAIGTELASEHCGYVEALFFFLDLDEGVRLKDWPRRKRVERSQRQ